MLNALGAKVTSKKGSRRVVVIGDFRGMLHEPHPRGEMRKYAVKYLRQLLEEAGIGPEG